MRAKRSPVRLGIVFGALLTPQFIALGAPTVALPELASGLHVPFGETSWVLTAWALMSAVAMPVFGTLTRRLGLRVCILAGGALTAVGSMTAAVAPDLLVVIVGRAVGGVGAGALVVTVYAAVAAQLDSWEQSRALGIVAATGAAASGCGALIGGAVTAAANWRVVVALPAAALLICPFAAALTGTERDRARRVDLTGVVLVTAVAVAVVVLLQAASTHLGTPVIAVLVVAGVTAAVLLIRRVRAVPDGFVPRRVVTAPGFLSAGATGLTVFAAYYAVLFAVPALVHTAMGWGPVAVGAALLPAAAFSVAGGRGAPPLARRTSVPAVAISGAVVATAGVLLAAVAGSTVLRVLGLGLTAGAFAAGQATLIGLVPRLVSAQDATTAQGLFDFVVYGGSSVGPAIVGGLSASAGLSHALLIAAALPCAGVGAAFALRARLRGRPLAQTPARSAPANTVSDLRFDRDLNLPEYPTMTTQLQTIGSAAKPIPSRSTPRDVSAAPASAAVSGAPSMLVSSTFSTPRHTTHYIECGPAGGALMLFLHGWPELSLMWRAQMDAFAADGWHCVAPDLRGYGGSSAPADSNAYTIEEVVADMAELHDHLGGKPAIWVGHDWGSVVAGALTAHEPERSRGVVLTSVPYFPDANALPTLVPLVDRAIYPADQYPDGQWDYYRYYTTHFEVAVADLDADQAASLASIFRPGDPAGVGKPSPNAMVTRKGGRFGTAHRAPPTRPDPALWPPADFDVLVQTFRAHGFRAPCAWYLNDDADIAYASMAPDGGRLSRPVLYVDGNFDQINTINGNGYGGPMRAACPDLTVTRLPAGHWLPLERKAEHIQAIRTWLRTKGL